MSDDVVFYPAGGNVALIGGREVPIGPERVTASTIIDKLRNVCGTYYSGPEPEKQGMTLLEAALFEAATQAADGDLEALDRVLNRLMGKPMQQVASVNFTGTLQDFLDTIAHDAPTAEVEDVDPFAD